VPIYRPRGATPVCVWGPFFLVGFESAGLSDKTAELSEIPTIIFGASGPDPVCARCAINWVTLFATSSRVAMSRLI
jgi:hypothetical protein